MTKEVLEVPNSNFLNCDTAPPTDASICKMDSWDSWQNTSQWLKHIVRGVGVLHQQPTQNQWHQLVQHVLTQTQNWENNVLKKKTISLNNGPMLLSSTAHREPVTRASAAKHNWTKWNTVKRKWARLFSWFHTTVLLCHAVHGMHQNNLSISGKS